MTWLSKYVRNLHSSNSSWLKFGHRRYYAFGGPRLIKNFKKISPFSINYFNKFYDKRLYSFNISNKKTLFSFLNNLIFSLIFLLYTGRLLSARFLNMGLQRFLGKFPCFTNRVWICLITSSFFIDKFSYKLWPFH